MKAIILCGRGSKKLPPHSNIGTSLSWVINSITDSGISDITVVGGKEIKKLETLEGITNLIHNPDWKTTGPLHSLYLCKDLLINSDTLICFGDVLFNSEALDPLIHKLNHKEIAILSDSNWLNRYERDTNSINKAEKIWLDKSDNLVQASREFSNNLEHCSEYTGICRVDKESVPHLLEALDNFLKRSAPPPNLLYHYGFMDIFSYLHEKGVKIHNSNIEDIWAEMDNSHDFNSFIFGTKSQTLSNVRGQLKSGKILTQVSFSVNQWQKESELIISKVKDHFKNKTLIVRSSSVSEDSLDSSMAGQFKSIIGVDRDNRQSIKIAVDEVIESYGASLSLDDFVFIQPALTDVILSGVVFSCVLRTGSPYYCVNYTNSDKTDVVTSGEEGEYELFYYFREGNIKIKDKLMKKLIKCVKEIENIVCSNSLDIEFAFNSKQELFIFQIRPIVKSNPIPIRILNRMEKELFNEENRLKNLFQPSNNISGETTILGKMPDWNPVELIGSRPQTLSFYLFERLITDNVWREARAEIGYFNPKGEKLLVNVLNQPFIDVRKSLNSLTPNGLPANIREKLINEAIIFLGKNPHLHDKLEFEVGTTCYTPSFSDRKLRWDEFGFNFSELEILTEHYKKHTVRMIRGDFGSCEEIIKKLEVLNTVQQKILDRKDINKIKKADLILEQCKTFGTIPFSILARFAFVSNTFLKSFVNKKIISKSSYNSYLNSIETVATDLLNEMEKLRLDSSRLDLFLTNFGHLRPGTFDINSLRYDEAPEDYFDFENSNNNSSIQSKFNFSPNEISNMSNILLEYGLDVDISILLNFIDSSIKGRELSKFLFSKSISEVLVLLVEWGNENNISREDMAFVNFDYLSKFADNKSIDIEKVKNMIKENKLDYEINKLFILPDLITDRPNLFSFHLSTNKPNFVTDLSISGIPVLIDVNSRSKDLNNKIVMIESADPGYDWIFTNNIKGLITKYGGAASHMTIRCSEFNIPAAIGCGNKFDSLVNSNEVIIDCNNQIIKKL